MAPAPGQLWVGEGDGLGANVGGSIHGLPGEGNDQGGGQVGGFGLTWPSGWPILFGDAYTRSVSEAPPPLRAAMRGLFPLAAFWPHPSVLPVCPAFSTHSIHRPRRFTVGSKEDTS